MLKRRLIPTLLLYQGRCVKGVRFSNFQDVGNPVTAARVYDAQGADELVFLDISATSEERETLLDIVSRTAEECFMPLSVGGGVRSIADVRALLRAGADKVVLNTAAVEDPDLVARIADVFGSQCAVVSIDARETDGADKYEVHTHAGRQPTGIDAIEHAQNMERLGAGEILVTAIDREGTRSGLDLVLTRRVAEAVRIPVIAHGGVGTLQHIVDGVRLGGASAIAAGTIFHFTDQSVIKARAFMRQAGLDVRLG